MLPISSLSQTFLITLQPSLASPDPGQTFPSLVSPYMYLDRTKIAILHHVSVITKGSWKIPCVQGMH